MKVGGTPAQSKTVKEKISFSGEKYKHLYGHA
jgi:hypothetical protein